LAMYSVITEEIGTSRALVMYSEATAKKVVTNNDNFDCAHSR
jgi:hypothetical protein